MFLAWAYDSMSCIVLRMDLAEREIREDLDSLERRVDAARARVRAFLFFLTRHPKSGSQSVLKTVEHLVGANIAEYDALLRELEDDVSASFETLIARKGEASERLRVLQSVSAGLIASLDWQSPTFAHALASQAGRQEGLIRATINDYKRDRHFDAENYERAFAREYLSLPSHRLSEVCVMASGMAAFTTIVLHILSMCQSGDTVLIGKDSYFQNKRVLRYAFGSRMRFVDEMDVEGILNAVKETNARALFLDTACNNASMAVPNLNALVLGLSKVVKQPLYLVLDNTVRSMTFQPASLLPLFGHALRLVVFESLMKFHQFGADRVTAGLAWAVGCPRDALFTTRMHAGTNIPDGHIHALPEPDRVVLQRRLDRLGRNAQWLAEALDQYLRQTPSLIISHVVYPGLASHPGYAWTKDMSFHGSYFVLAFADRSAKPEMYDRFVNAVMTEAKKAGVPINGGTSFGFDMTRIYLTARYAGEGTVPFLRVSVGMETIDEIKRLKEVFVHAIERC